MCCDSVVDADCIIVSCGCDVRCYGCCVIVFVLLIGFVVVIVVAADVVNVGTRVVVICVVDVGIVCVVIDTVVV